MTRILVRAPNWIGDQVLAYPFFYHLRQAYPSAHIAVVCLPWVESLQFKAQINDVLVLERPQDTTLWAKWRALTENAHRVRAAGPWDLGICLPNSFSSAWIFYRGGVEVIRGYATDARGFLLKEKVDWQKGRDLHRSDAYVQLLREFLVGSQPGFSERLLSGATFWGSPATDPLDHSVPGVLSHFDPIQEWPDTAPIEPPVGPYWVMAPGTTAESRQWPLEYFKEFAKQTGMKGLILGGPKEKAQAAALVGDELEDWTGRGSVASLWKVFRGAQFTLSNDSGLGHVASLCGSPLQIVWGAGNPVRTRPIGPGRVRMVFNSVSCWPCERNTCSQVGAAHLQCLRGISPEAIWKEISTAEPVKRES